MWWKSLLSKAPSLKVVGVDVGARGAPPPKSRNRAPGNNGALKTLCAFSIHSTASSMQRESKLMRRYQNRYQNGSDGASFRL